MDFEFLILNFIFLCYTTTDAADQMLADDTLVLVQTLSRHGDRTPSATFPNDKYKHLWTELGMEQLTEKGIHQLLELGQFFRKRYSNFLPKVFQKDQIYVRSTSTERTLLSAQSCMHGLFPPVASVPVSMQLGRQWVPIHSMLKEHDQLLKMSSPCPAYKKAFRLFKSSPEFQTEVTRFSELISAFQANSGLPQEEVTLSKVWSICDPIVVWSDHKFDLPLWVTERVIKDCQAVGHLKHRITFSTSILSRLRGAPLARQMMLDARRVALTDRSVRYRRRLIAYFAHDSTLGALLSALKAHNNLKPPVASSLMLELHHLPQTDLTTVNLSHFVVRLYYRNTTHHVPYQLPLGLCSVPLNCPLSELLPVILKNSPTDIVEECSLRVATPSAPGGGVLGVEGTTLGAKTVREQDLSCPFTFCRSVLSAVVTFCLLICARRLYCRRKC